VAVAVASTALEAVSGSAVRAASDGPATEAVLRVAAALALVGAGALAALARPHDPAPAKKGTGHG